MSTIIKYVFPSFLIFLGGLLGVYLTSKFNHDDWSERVTYEQQVRLFQQRLNLLERTSSITAKIPAIDDLFALYFTTHFDSLKQEKLSKEDEISLAEKLGNLRAEFNNVILLDQIYFGDSTKEKIVKYIITDKRKVWWKIPEENFNDILVSMANELPINKNRTQYVPSPSRQQMSDLSKIIWTAIATLIGGILIYVSGRIIEKFVLEPLQEYRKTLASISDTLIFYADIYGNTQVASKENKIETSKALRKHASELSSKTNQIAFYKFFVWCKVVPRYDDSIEAVSTLIGLSNSMWHSDIGEIIKRREKIETLLKIKA